MELKDGCLKAVALPVFEVVAFVSRGVLPSLREGGWAGFGSLQRQQLWWEIVTCSCCCIVV